MLDVAHDGPSEVSHGDDNAYQLGSIGKHNIVIASLPLGSYGTTSAAVVATQMKSTFVSLKIYLMVGIGGGIPSASHDIRLGDIVVSKPENTFGGVVQDDLGKTVKGGHFERSGSLNKPPQVLLTTIASLKANHALGQGRNNIPDYVSEAHRRYPSLIQDYSYQGQENDILFKADYEHEEGPTCKNCVTSKQVQRKPRHDTSPVIHHGIIASGNQVIKHAPTRDNIGKDSGAICFEMEAAGLMDHYPSLVVRGICDYSDSHKNKHWQPYAALTAAAYAKELLHQIAPLAPIGITAQHAPPIVEQHIFDIPRILHPQFSGRQKYLTQIYESFRRRPDDQEGSIVSIFGMPGAGKSQLCLKYVVDNKNNYSYGFYSIAKTEDHWLSSCDSISQALGLPGIGSNSQVQRMEGLKRWFATKSNWILIIDDVSSAVVPLLRNSLPHDLGGHILISTRDKYIAQEFSSSDSCIHLREMDPSEGKDLILKVSGQSGDTAEVAEKISRQLGGLPLALEQSAKCAAQRFWSLDALFENLQESKLAVIENAVENPQHADVSTTLDIALAELQPAHACILNLVLMMRPQALPLTILMEGATNLTFIYPGQHVEDANKQSSQKGGWRRNYFRGLFRSSKLRQRQTSPADVEKETSGCVDSVLGWDQATRRETFEQMKDILLSKIKLDAMILTLEKSSIIRRSENGNIWVHDLFHELLLSKLEGTDKKAFASYATLIMCSAFPSPNSATLRICSSYLPHALEVISLADTYHLHISQTIRQMVAIVTYFLEIGRYRESIKRCERLLRTAKNTLDEDSQVLVDVAAVIGNAMFAAGKLYKSLEFHKWALKFLVGAFKESAKDIPNLTDFSVTITASLQKEWKDEAWQLCKSAVKTIENTETIAKRDPHKMILLIELVTNTLFELGWESDQAVEILQRVVSIRTNLWGGEDLWTLSAMSSLARSLAACGRYEEALRLDEGVFAINVKAIGRDQALINPSSFNCAAHLYKLKRFSECRQLCEELLIAQERVLWKHSRGISNTLGLLGQTLEREGKNEEALKCYARVLSFEGAEMVMGREYYLQASQSMTRLEERLREREFK
ncbi:hypothetical protein TWF481_001450 [Arthrobotrys musiformis]|uniref:NB-ARC domain-containing protein n=1 Tax=Arthrobotrys musiformis TaxID=47236 RepID=A0AAV9WQJ7_9PEZI